jgi:hypothetical protein
MSSSPPARIGTRKSREQVEPMFSAERQKTAVEEGISHCSYVLFNANHKLLMRIIPWFW